MVEAYWNVGRLNIEEEQCGEQRAEYEKHLINELSIKLTKYFGKAFTRTNLWYMCQFYSLFPNLHALRGDLSWTHYLLLINKLLVLNKYLRYRAHLKFLNVYRSVLTMALI